LNVFVIPANAGIQRLCGLPKAQSRFVIETLARTTSFSRQSGDGDGDGDGHRPVIHFLFGSIRLESGWIPAFAGMTEGNLFQGCLKLFPNPESRIPNPDRPNRPTAECRRP